MESRYVFVDSNKGSALLDTQSLTVYKASTNIAESLRELHGIKAHDIKSTALRLDHSSQALIAKHFGEDVGAPITEYPNYVELNLMLFNDCNMRCSYCFAEDILFDKFSGRMQLETALKACEIFLDTGYLTSVIFMGGEPTLAFDMIEKIVRHVRSFSSQKGIKTPLFPMVTNALSLNEKMFKTISDLKMELIVSVDGPEQIHDSNRVLPGNRPTFKTIATNMETARELRIPFTVEATYTRQHMEAGYSITDTHKFLSGFGPQSVYIMPVVSQNKLVGFNDEDSSYLLESFMEAGHYVARNFGSDLEPYITYPKSVISLLGEKRSRLQMCDAGINSFTVMPKGQVYPCYFLVDDKDFLGTVDDCNSQEIVSNIKGNKEFNHKRFFSSCADCWASSLCFSCFGPSVQENKGKDSPPEYFCSALKGYIIGTIIGLCQNNNLIVK